MLTGCDTAGGGGWVGLAMARGSLAACVGETTATLACEAALGLADTTTVADTGAGVGATVGCWRRSLDSSDNYSVMQQFKKYYTTQFHLASCVPTK